jgi:CRP/FNR family transcriptional regulator, cyclic AMP receptor protein
MNTTKDFGQSSQRGKEGRGPDDLEKIIAEHPFLKGLSPHQCRILTDCAMFTKFEPGELLLREGDPANRFYLILRGKVSVESYAPDSGATPIQTVGGGEVLGWSWLFPPYYWHFSARAVELTEAVFFYGTPLRDECEADHDLGYELLKRMAEVMMKRLQATRRQLLNWNPNQAKQT